MASIRIIPRLDIKGPDIVKGIHLEGLRVLGKPEDFARYYYEQGADELIYQDVVASLYERNSLQDIISRTARRVFIPITVGGGIRSVEDIGLVLRAGADKVSLNTAVVREPELIRSASRKFGSSTIVVALEVIRQPDGRYLCYTDNGREETGLEAVSWATTVAELGAGEIMLTSVDREGTGSGFDLELISKVAAAVTLPIIAHGGLGIPAHGPQAVQAGATAICAASVLHYHYISQSPTDTTDLSGNTAFLKSGKAFGKIRPASLEDLRNEMLAHGFECRVP